MKIVINEPEEWRPIDGYEGYEVSNLGNVRSLNFGRTGVPKNLKPYKDKDGYLGVRIGHGEQRPTRRVSRLVAEAFIPNPNNYPQVNHIDEDKSNNRVDNLEWCTCEYNIRYGTANQRRAEKHSKKIKAILPDGSIEYYSSLSEAAQMVNGFISNISKCLHGERERTCSRKWVFEEEVDNAHHN